MVSFDRENKGSSDDEFKIDFAQGPLGRFHCTVGRGGTVSLSGGPFKSLSSARVWARTVVTGLLRADLVNDQTVTPAPETARVITFAGANAPELEGEGACIHCSHAEGEHTVDGSCAHAAQGGSRYSCPCTWFEGVPVDATEERSGER